MRPRNPPLQAKAFCLIGKCFNMPAQGIIAFVTVHIHHQAPFRGKLAQQFHRVRTLLHGAFKMRNAPDYVHAHIQGADGIF